MPLEGLNANGLRDNHTRRRAMVVGISDYDILPSLNFCENDGHGMNSTLASLDYKIADGHAVIGTVTGDKMRDKVIDFFLDADVNPSDLLLFYYSGHGIPDIDGDVYLAASDTDPEVPSRRGFSLQDLSRMTEKCVARKIVLILDCCFSGAARIEGKGLDDAAAKLARTAFSSSGTGEGRYILASSLPLQQAFDLKDSNYSIFTYYVLAGLKGSASSVDEGGYVTVNTLFRFVYDSMLNLPWKSRSRQVPVIKIEKARGEVILAHHQALSVRAGFPQKPDRTIPLNDVLKMILDKALEQL